MHTEAVFEEIAKRIEQEIGKAQSSIIIAVAWFTNRNLFDVILKKAQQGCRVHLMITDDEINNNSQIDYRLLEQHQSHFYKIGNDEKALMHNKFCIIDHTIVITGSYNWSYKAEINHENIVIHYKDHELAKQFVAEFDYIRSIYFPDSAKQNRLDADDSINEIIKRLEVLQHFIVLKDLEDIEYATTKLKKFQPNETVSKVITLVNNQSFGQAIEEIQQFIARYKQLIVWNDPEINGLQLELKILENQINAFENEKIDLEKIITDFQYQHTKELGELILAVLKIQKQKFKDNEKRFKEAENDYNEYQKQYTNEIEREVYTLNDEQKRELKKEYKNASILCHPDKFANEPLEKQQQAEQLFKELNEAHSKNDLNRVKEISANLQKGILSVAANKQTDKDLLKLNVERLKQKMAHLQTEIEQIKQSDVFIQISAITNWDTYFKDQKELLEKELEDLQYGQ